MGEKGLVEEDWNDRDEWRKKILLSVQWAQEDVETSYNLLNNNRVFGFWAFMSFICSMIRALFEYIQ